MPRPIQIHLPEIPDAERTPLVERLVVLIEALAQENQRQAETIQPLRDEIAVLKGEQRKPTFKPSGMEEETTPDAPPPEDGGTGADDEAPPKKRPGSHKRRKTRQLTIHQEIPVPPRATAASGIAFQGLSRLRGPRPQDRILQHPLSPGGMADPGGGVGVRRTARGAQRQPLRPPPA